MAPIGSDNDITNPRANDPDNPSGSTRQTPPRRGGQNINRTIILCALAMLAGYLFANRGRSWFDGREDAVVDFETMNTYGRIRVPRGDGLTESPARIAELAVAAVKRVNDLMSPFGTNSDVKRLNEAAPGEWVSVDPLTWTVVMEALRWHRLSGGAFDPTIGPVKSLFRFDRSTLEGWPSEEEVAEARAKVGADKLLFEREGMRLGWAVPGMKLDLGAIAKGFGADCAAEVLLRHGVKNALVDIGGELRVLGMKPGDPSTTWKAGIRNPRGDDVLETLGLSTSAVATSGDYERYFLYEGKRYEHIIDPRKGLPMTNGPASVTVVHPDSCLAADALATTMSVLGETEGEEFLRAQALGLFSHGVRVIMLLDAGEGSWNRINFVVESGGEVRVDRGVVVAE